ncbi:MAG: RloB family protein [Planctomycetaceae bacterium]|jgi:hypothetical protein|nr:RloB family protein [Planctomycetaceae bacterium]
MTPKQNRGAGKRRSPAVPLNYYESRAEKRQSNLFFIFCNGKVTEMKYFTELVKDLAGNNIRSQFLTVEFVNKAPKQIVEHARDYVNKYKRSYTENNDIVWVVFDQDDFGENYSTAISLAQQSHINVAYSNVCFELWLLLHFQEQTKQITRANLTKLLQHKQEENKKTKIESKSKLKHFPYGIIRKYGNRELAVERAEKLHNTASQKLPETPWEINPVTNVYQLVRELQKFCNIQ